MKKRWVILKMMEKMKWSKKDEYKMILLKLEMIWIKMFLFIEFIVKYRFDIWLVSSHSKLIFFFSSGRFLADSVKEKSGRCCSSSTETGISPLYGGQVSAGTSTVLHFRCISSTDVIRHQSDCRIRIKLLCSKENQSH